MATTTATPAALRGMVAVSDDFEELGGEPLGWVSWFSVPDEDIRRSRLTKKLLEAGLPPELLPGRGKAINAFKRAVRSVEGIRHHDNGTTTERTVAFITDKGDTVDYQVSVLVRDLEQREIDYDKAIRVFMLKKDQTVDFNPLGGVPFDVSRTIMDEITQAFDAAQGSVTGATVRSMVRNYLRDDTDDRVSQIGLSGENLRGKAGGIYFVLHRFHVDLDKLAKFLWTLYPSKAGVPGQGRAYLHMIPLADGASQRELVRRHHIENFMSDSQEAITDVAELLREGRKRGVRENVIRHHMQRLDRANDHAKAYAEALGEEQQQVQFMVEQMRKQLRKLPTL